MSWHGDDDKGHIESNLVHQTWQQFQVLLRLPVFLFSVEVGDNLLWRLMGRVEEMVEAKRES
jgi:hypothetical protein